jgi:hypothetical protein
MAKSGTIDIYDSFVGIVDQTTFSCIKKFAIEILGMSESLTLSHYKGAEEGVP